MYFAMLAFVMLAVAHAAPLDSASSSATPADTLPSNTGRRFALKRDNIPAFVVASPPSGTKTTRSMPMAMQARAPEIISHSRTEETRRSTIDRDEGRRERASSSSSPRAYKRSKSEQWPSVEEVEKRWNSKTPDPANDVTSKLRTRRGVSVSDAGALYPRAQDHSSNKSTYQPISSISSRQLRAPDYDSAGNQSNSTTGENGSHPTKDEEQKHPTKDQESKEKRAGPVEWSKTWSEERRVTDHRRSPSDDRIAQRDEGSLLVARPGDQDVSA
ncbi:hypothetical protein ARMSODRAFT_952634 [Armillaria solidipes]|uniref:Uncharacterized protein n=1 Tax=Armillaria solidipes TaxID=1076256 RepID=A0A2H3BRM8_9AGAR|nr:hypothetical protein ARMSODRAFT_952634 [Armillaria solidipes]